MAQAKVEEMARDGKRVVILDAAVLLAANWHKELCDEVTVYHALACPIRLAFTTVPSGLGMHNPT